MRLCLQWHYNSPHRVIQSRFYKELPKPLLDLLVWTDTTQRARQSLREFKIVRIAHIQRLGFGIPLDGFSHKDRFDCDLCVEVTNDFTVMQEYP